ncbi:MAG: hypothetical protein PVG22_13325 [Chromatiales bacterium]|jgi:hypothetical protein
MKRPTFFEGALVALVMSLVGSVLFTVLSPLMGGENGLRWLIAGMSLGYVVYLLKRSHEPVGRITVVLGWLMLTTVVGFLELSLPVYLIVHLLGVWLIRSLYFYAGILPTLLDLGLSALSLATGFWAFAHTSSLFLSIWCLFLVQALFVAIPASIRSKATETESQSLSGERFEQAYRGAQTALRKLSSIH